MTALFTVLSLILLILGITAMVFSFFVRKEREVRNEGSRYEEVLEPTPPALRRIASKKFAFILLFVGAGFMVLSNSIYYAERGTYYEIIYPNGNKTAEFNEGYHLVPPFTRVNSWTANIDVKAGDVQKMSDDVEGKMNSVGVTFVDQVGADISAAFRFTLPRDEKTFLDLAVKYRSIENLVENTLIPTVAEQAKLTSKMFSAQDYISGSSQAFRQTFEEQLKGGTFVVEKYTNRDTTWTKIQNTNDREIQDISISYSVNKVLDSKTKLPKRIQNEISASGIIVSQVIVEDVDVDASYKKRLVAQKQESAKRQLEQQKIETAKIAQQRIKAEGERDKEQERVNQEKKQVSQLIAIETKLKQEKTNKELAEIQLKTEKINAEKLKVAADAEAYEIKRKVSAGITPEKRLQMELDASVARAEAIAKTKWPEIYMPGGGSGSGGDNNALQLLILDAIKNNKK